MIKEEKIFDGRWKVIYHNRYVILENIYNGEKIKIYESQYQRLLKGTDSVSHIICRKIKDKGNFIIDNNVKKAYAKQVQKYAIKKLSK